MDGSLLTSANGGGKGGKEGLGGGDGGEGENGKEREWDKVQRLISSLR